MPRRIDSVSVAFAEQHRHLLPEGFMQEVDALEAELV
jgi:hypothetical protein